MDVWGYPASHEDLNEARGGKGEVGCAAEAPIGLAKERPPPAVRLRGDECLPDHLCVPHDAVGTEEGEILCLFLRPSFVGQVAGCDGAALTCAPLIEEDDTELGGGGFDPSGAF